MTSRIAGALVLAFIIFVVVRGELPSYLGVLGLNSSVPSPATGGAVSTAASNTVSTPALLGSLASIIP